MSFLINTYYYRQGGGGSVTPSPLGTIYEDAFDGVALSGYTSSATVNTSVADGDLTLSADNQALMNSWIIYNAVQCTLEEFKRTVDFKIGALGLEEQAGGIGIGLMTFQGVPVRGFAAEINLATISNTHHGKIQWLLTNDPNTSGTVTIAERSIDAIVSSAGDECSLILERIDAITFKATYVNHTQGQTIESTFSGFDLQAPQTYTKPGNYKFGMWCFGGIYIVHNDLVTSTTTSAPKLLLIGDSITFGNFAGVSGLPARWANLVGEASGGTYVVEAGPGDRVVDLVSRLSHLQRYSPNYVIIAIGSNDLGGDATAFKNNLTTVVEGLELSGAIVILCRIIPRTTTDTTPFNDKIAEFTTHTVVDTHTPFTIDSVEDTLNTSLYHSDKIHPNSNGHAVFADAVIAGAPEIL